MAAKIVTFLLSVDALRVVFMKPSIAAVVYVLAVLASWKIILDNER